MLYAIAPAGTICGARPQAAPVKVDLRLIGQLVERALKACAQVSPWSSPSCSIRQIPCFIPTHVFVAAVGPGSNFGIDAAWTEHGSSAGGPHRVHPPFPRAHPCRPVRGIARPGKRRCQAIGTLSRCEATAYCATDVSAMRNARDVSEQHVASCDLRIQRKKPAVAGFLCGGYWVSCRIFPLVLNFTLNCGKRQFTVRSP
jgi:hypothetical protein